MTFVERYDRLIQLIETSIAEKRNNISRYLSAKLGMNVRHIENAFVFITDQTLKKYIHERFLVNMINSCKNQNMTLEKMAELYGRDPSSLSRAIKNQFGKPFSMLTAEDMEHHQPWTFSVLMKYEEPEKAGESEELKKTEEPEPEIPSEKPDDFLESLFHQINEDEESASSHAHDIQKFPDDAVEYARELQGIYDTSFYRICNYVKKLEQMLYYQKNSEMRNIKDVVKKHLSEYEEKAVFLLSVRHSMHPNDAFMEVRRLQSEGITDIMAEGDDFMEILSYLSDMRVIVPGKEIRHIVEVMKEYSVAVPATWQLLEELCREHKTIEEMLQMEKYRFLLYSDPDWEPEIDFEDLYRASCEEDELIEETDYYSEQDDYERLEEICYGRNEIYDDMEDMDGYIERICAFSEFGEDADPETNPQLYNYLEMQIEEAEVIEKVTS